MGLLGGLILQWVLAFCASAVAIFITDNLSEILGNVLLFLVGLWMLVLIFASLSTGWKALQVLIRGPRPEDFM